MEKKIILCKNYDDITWFDGSRLGIIFPDPDPYPALILNYVFLKRGMFVSARSHQLAIKSYRGGSDLMDICYASDSKMYARRPRTFSSPLTRIADPYSLSTYLDPAFFKVFDPDLEVQNATLNEKILN